MTRDEFLKLVMPELPECPVPLVMSVANDVLEDFCKKTSCWTEVVDPIFTLSGVHTYTIDPPAAAKVIDLQSVSANGQPVHPMRIKDIALSTPGWDQAVSAAPRYFEFTGVGDIRLWPTPSQDDVAITVVARLAPAPSLQELPLAVMTTYGKAISRGARSALMLMQKKPWTDQAMGAYYGSRFEQDIADASSRSMSAGSTGDVFVKPVRFGGYR